MSQSIDQDFHDHKEWRTWLKRNHSSEKEVWVIIQKKKSERNGLKYREAVEEAICFGWIDSKMQSIDNNSFRQRFSPRKKNSIWSKKNKETAEKMIQEGKMKKSGFETINMAKSLPLHTVNFAILQLLPGSAVRRIAHEYGEVNYDFSIGTGHPGDTLSFVPFGLTKDYLIKMQRRAYREFFVRPIQIFRLLKSIDSWEDIKKYYKLLLVFLKLYCASARKIGQKKKEITPHPPVRI